MADAEDVPNDFKTVGELRAYLKRTHARWEVDPKLEDSDLIPKKLAGGKWVGEPEHMEPTPSRRRSSKSGG